ncbi:MAG: hypothetical protein AABY22_01495 [Nanoarchaeota archaeon]
MNINSIERILSNLLDEIDYEKSDLERGYSWKQSFLKKLFIPLKHKKELGYWGD